MNNKFLKEMFNASKRPTIDFGLNDISQSAQKTSAGFSISGVQPKLSVKLDKKQNLLVLAEEGGEYILKPQNSSFLNVPENEQCCMEIADSLVIDVPPHCLISMKDEKLAYLVKRFDREKGRKIHQEDFAQVLEKTDKYNGSVEQIGRKLREISSAPGYDVQLFFERVVLSFIIGNGDAHLKNYSISYKNKGNIRLSPAYDIVCSKLVLTDEEDSALTINAKRNKLQRSDFDELANYLNIPIKVRYEKFENKLALMKEIVNNSQIEEKKQQQFIEIIKERLNRLRLSE